MSPHNDHWFSIRYSLLLIAPFAVLLLLPMLAPQPEQAQAQTTAPDLFISEYVEGSINNKAIEIYNGTGAAVDLSMYTVELYNNGATTPNQTFTLSGTLTTGEVFVIANPSAAQAILNEADVTDAVTEFNGDDVLILKNDETIVDSFGQLGNDPGSEWSGGGVGTQNETLRRKASVCEGDTNPDDAFDPSVEWDSFAEDTFDGLGAHTCDDSSSADPTPAFIHEIQGDGPDVITGTYVITGIVVGDFQSSEQLSGFFVQEEDDDSDDNPETSEGIFVFCDTCPDDVEVGDQVEVTGEASDYFGMSQLSATSADDITVLSSDNPLPIPATLKLPVPNVPTDDLGNAEDAINDYYEDVEGMLVMISGPLTVAEYFQLSRFGQLVLAEGDRLRQFTDANMPSATGYISHQIDVERRTIILDDDDNTQNSALEYGDPVYHPVPGFSTINFVRGGYTITDLTGVLHWSWAGSGGTDAWRIRPVVDNDYPFNYDFTATNPRPDSPAVNGDITVASFNVLNYFTTIDDGTDACGPDNDQGCRGADSQAELERQTTKIVTAMIEIDADIYGLNELENNDTTALQALVDALNDEAGAGTYDFISTGAITSSVSSDAIKVGLIYNTTTVTPTGTTAVLNTPAFVDPNNLGDAKNRPAVAQAFQVSDSTNPSFEEELVVVVNHLKSKGSPCGTGDDDETTGQGNCNGTRTQGAQELANWLGTDPTGTGVENILITGDLNAYREEDPIVALEDEGYTDLLDTELGSDVYTYVFDGQLGYLDYVLANQALLPAVVDVVAWNINADEVNLLDYNDTIEDSGEAFFEAKPDANPLYSPDEYRSSDHDPVIVGLDLTAEPTFKLYLPFIAK